MKSAWMLFTLSAWVLAGLCGCLQPNWVLAPPAAPPQSSLAALPGPTRSGEPERSQATATAPGEDTSDAPSDPEVTALSQRIEAMADRTATPAAETGAAGEPRVVPAALTGTSPINANPPQANTTSPTALTKTKTGEREAAPVEANPTASANPPTAAVTIAPIPTISPAPLPTAQPAGAPEPMIANAPTAAWVERPSATEAVASQAPHQVPIITPSPTVESPSVEVEITDVQPVTAAAPVEAAPAQASPNQPAQAEAPAKAADLRSVIAEFEKTLAAKPPHPQDELKLRLLYLAAGMEEKVAEPVKGMDPVQSELLNSIVKAVACSEKAMMQPTEASPEALGAAEELRRLLGQQSGVSIPRIAMVTKVNSYGDYDAIDPLRFKAGKEIHAYVYTEVTNYRNEPVDNDRLRALLGERVQVFDAAGKMVWERHENQIEDRVRTPRHDFFIPFPIKLPSTLPPGEYVVKVTVEDRVGGTTDQQRLSFAIQ